MLRNIGTARAKHIRRRLEEITANGQYLSTTHDTREAGLIAELLRRNVDDQRHLQAEHATLLQLAGIDGDENRRHVEIWREGQCCNREVAECEDAHYATEPPVETVALAG